MSPRYAWELPRYAWYLSERECGKQPPTLSLNTLSCALLLVDGDVASVFVAFVAGGEVFKGHERARACARRQHNNPRNYRPPPPSNLCTIILNRDYWLIVAKHSKQLRSPPQRLRVMLFFSFLSFQFLSRSYAFIWFNLSGTRTPRHCAKPSTGRRLTGRTTSCSSARCTSS